MKKIIPILLQVLILSACQPVKYPNETREVTILDSEWLFYKGELEGAELPGTNTEKWERIDVPHDWAISGEFDEAIDAQEIQVLEDGDSVAKIRTGRTGALPHIGIGWYRRAISLDNEMRDKQVHIEFDGAMSHAKVYMNGVFVGEWPYGYSSFGFNLTPFINFGEENILAIRLENQSFSSRWYPGAGIYRKVRLVLTQPVYVRQWGTYITTPEIKERKGDVNISTTIVNKSGEIKNLTLETTILSPDGRLEDVQSVVFDVNDELCLRQELKVESVQLWSVDSPGVYTAVSRILENGIEQDIYRTTFGFRFFEFTSDSGFYLNGEPMRLNGVCLHHDLGPLGAAVNDAAHHYRLKMLREMGCNAIRTSHNPPAPELLDMCDTMGFLVIDEAFDEWKYGKTENGYNTLWDEWAEKDMRALIRRDRNHPSVIMWSIGNEIREQGIEGGDWYCRFLVDICKEEDPTRPTTAGFNQWTEAIKNGFAEIVDVPGWNYKPQHYNYIHKKFPHWKMYGSETASTVSSRGAYFFPAAEKIHFTRVPYHSSSFDMEFPRWATSPDREFAAQDSFPFIAGEFVWTGFDYLGEPTPFNIEWPARSSYFGIIDLCGIPKDRYYLYQSKWTNKEVLHILPHWNWEEGDTVSVHCYTSFNKGELFLNSKSMGMRKKNGSSIYTTYRLVWDNIIYQPGELKVVALDEFNKPLKESVVRTAGEPAKIELSANRTELTADGNDLAFVTVSVVDINGILCPNADNLVRFTVEGSGDLKAAGSGDPTSLESFVKPFRKAFNGKCMAIVQSSKEKGVIVFKAESDGLQSSEIKITSEK